MNKEKEKKKEKEISREKKGESVEKTSVHAFFTSRPPLPIVQGFCSSPSVFSLSRYSIIASNSPVLNASSMPESMPESSPSEFFISESNESKTPSSSSTKGLRQYSDLETSLYDYELQISPLQTFPPHFLKKSLSSISLSDGRESADEVNVSELFQFYRFIFNFSFGDERIIKKCSAKFFNSTTVVDPTISNPVKQYFYKIIIKNLNPIKAKMLLGDSADERLLFALAEHFRYLKEEIPSTNGIDVESYIRAIANNQPPGEFPYAEIENEKFDFLCYALQQNYEFFEYIFTENDTPPAEGTNIFLKVQRWLYHKLSCQFILSQNEEELGRIQSELLGDDEEKIQVPSKLKITARDLQKSLYRHLKTLLIKNKPLSISAAKTAFLLIRMLSFELIQKGKRRN